MSVRGIFYVPRPDTTPEAEAGALASVYAFIMRTDEEKKKAARPDRSHDAEESKNDRPTEPDRSL